MKTYLPIKSISVETREWSDGSFGPFIHVSRWDDEKNEDGTRKNYKLAQFYHPTRASVFRAIQAMEAMTKRTQRALSMEDVPPTERAAVA